jgi:integrase/recombinase XerD
MGQLRERMEMAMRMRNFSSRTIECYVWQAKAFVRKYGKSPAEMGEEEVRGYLQWLVERKVSWSMIRIAYSALKFLYVDTLGREWKLGRFLHPKGEKRLPVVLSVQEVKRLFDAVEKRKQRMVLMTCYSSGVRVGEAVHLKVKDIDSQRMQLRVDQGKGKKDRYTLLSPGLCEQLREYWKTCRPQVWLFPGEKSPDRPLTVDSVQRAFREAKKKRGLQNPLRFILFVIALPLTCWSPALISSPFKSSLAIRA